MNTLRLALFGSPVGHSPSPRLHKAFAAQFDLDIDYRLIEASPADFPEKLDRFRWGGGRGCNITLPLKHIACNLADSRTGRAETASAANTLWWDESGQLNADNTDGRGLVRDMINNLEMTITGRELLILGAGGATAGIMGPLLECNPGSLTIANRTVERAEALAIRHSRLGKTSCISIRELGRCPKFHLVIDATSTGHQGLTPDIPRHIISDSEACYSLNYGRAAKPLENWCQQLETSFHSGWGMLVEQAALSFEIWTGKRPDTRSVLDSLSPPSD